MSSENRIALDEKAKKAKSGVSNQLQMQMKNMTIHHLDVILG